MTKKDMLVKVYSKVDSAIPIQVSILFQILFPFKLLQNIEPSSLYYTVDPISVSKRVL